MLILCLHVTILSNAMVVRDAVFACDVYAWLCCHCYVAKGVETSADFVRQVMLTWLLLRRASCSVGRSAVTRHLEQDVIHNRLYRSIVTRRLPRSVFLFTKSLHVLGPDWCIFFLSAAGSDKAC